MSVLPGFISNSDIYNQLVSWIAKPNSVFGKTLNKECVCIVSGCPGSGKTHGIKSAIVDANKHICYINKDECINSKDFKELLLKQTYSNIVDQFNLLNINNQCVTETVIFIDDVDTLLAIDRSFINNFNLLISCNTIKTIKIILSCISSELKVVLKSILFGQLLLLKSPTNDDIKTIIKNYTHTHTHTLNQYCPYIDTVINDSVKSCNGNIYVAMNIFKLNIQKYTNNDNKKCIESTDIFPEVAKIYYLEDRSLIRKVVQQDPWLHPLRFHENIIHEFKQRNGSKDIKDKTYINILQNLCEWDQLMTNSKGGDISYAIEQSCSTIQILTRLKRKKTAEPPVDEFTRIFNYLSLRKKNIVTLYEGKFQWDTIGSMRKKIYDGIIRKETKLTKTNKLRSKNNTKKLTI